MPLRPTAAIYDATKRADMHSLALALRSLRGAEAAVVAASLIERRVMWPPLLYRIPAWIAQKRGVPENVFWAHFYTNPKNGAELTLELLADAARWAISGDDREDPHSYGGFSQREVNFIAGLTACTHDAVERIAA